MESRRSIPVYVLASTSRGCRQRTLAAHKMGTGMIPVPRRRRIVRGRRGRGRKGRRDESEGEGLSQQVDREPIVPENQFSEFCVSVT